MYVPFPEIPARLLTPFIQSFLFLNRYLMAFYLPANFAHSFGDNLVTMTITIKHSDFILRTTILLHTALTRSPGKVAIISIKWFR